MDRQLDCGGRLLDLSRPQVMGILNITPDSFSDGGNFLAADVAVARAREMVEQGADIIDVGGESTRPGARAVAEQEELERVIPVIEAISKDLAVPVSVDTSKASVMGAAVEAGAGLINDVRALREPGALEAAAKANVPVCLMHMQGQPRTMQESPEYADVVGDVVDFLRERSEACLAAGIDADQIVLDPGFGFGKTLAHNRRLMQELEQVGQMGYPLLVGVSRKRMIGELLGGREVDDRVLGSVGAACAAAGKGAAILRVHDVKETADALRVFGALWSE